MDIVKRVPYPPANHLVGVAQQGRHRFVELGDLTSIVAMPWTPMMTVAPVLFIRRRQFVLVRTVKAWVKDLESKGHRKSAAKLHDLMAWVESVPVEEVVRHG